MNKETYRVRCHGRAEDAGALVVVGCERAELGEVDASDAVPGQVVSAARSDEKRARGADVFLERTVLWGSAG